VEWFSICNPGIHRLQIDSMNPGGATRQTAEAGSNWQRQRSLRQRTIKAAPSQ
jgi:hypothetical protein